MDEFELIAKYFRPLTGGEAGAFGLTDDAAVLSLPPDHELVLKTDAIVAGTHFLPNDPVASVARKALRVNLSDLAAKGAKPIGYLLTCVWPRGTEETTIAEFAHGLRDDQREFGVSLFGGDTTTGTGPMMFSVTAFGSVPKGRMILRSGAKAGQLLFVTGTIGDAALGLRILRGERTDLTFEDRLYLSLRYQIPLPRLAFMGAAREHISAALDVSDGLVADAGHMASASGCRIEIDAASVPLSRAAAAFGGETADIAALATAGDDYEVCFAADASSVPALKAAAEASGTEVTQIGRILSGTGAELIAANGKPIPLQRKGYSHF